MYLTQSYLLTDFVQREIHYRCEEWQEKNRNISKEYFMPFFICQKIKNLEGGKILVIHSKLCSVFEILMSM